jgi:hypothetical protein
VIRPEQRHRRLVRLLAATVLCGALTAALPAPGAGAATRATAPGPWAKSVCGALDGWVTGVSAASTKAATAKPKSAAVTKKTLNLLLARTVKETAKLRKRLASAGKPSVPRGKQIAATVREGFRQVESSLQGAKRSLAAAKTSDPTTFTAATRAAQDALESGLESIQAAFSAARDADTGPLLTAFDKQAACQRVTG